jgi:hypothetical protein
MLFLNIVPLIMEFTVTAGSFLEICRISEHSGLDDDTIYRGEGGREAAMVYDYVIERMTQAQGRIQLGFIFRRRSF